MSNARNLSNLLGTGATIATAKIADDAITSAKIADDAVVAAAIADDAIVAAAIADDAVGSAAIATDAVGADALSSSAISTGDFPSGTIIKTTRGTTGNEGTGTFSISATSQTDTTLGFTINKQISASTLIGVLTFSFGSDFTAQKWIASMTVRRGSTNVFDTLDTTNGFFWHLGDDQNHRRDYYWYTTGHFFDNTSGTGDQTYDWYIMANSNSGAIRGGGIRYIIHEVKT